MSLERRVRLFLGQLAIFFLFIPTNTVASADDRHHQQVLQKVQLAIEVGDPSAAVKVVQSIDWDRQATPELLMLYTLALLDLETPVSFDKWLGASPKSARYAHAYSAAIRGHIADAEVIFQQMLTDAALSAWGAIGLTEIGLLTDNVELLGPAVNRLKALTDADNRRQVKALVLEYQSQLLARQGKAADAEQLVRQNRKIANAYFYCTFILSGVIDRQEYEALGTVTKNCRRFESWPTYAIELNRATFDKKGAKAAEYRLKSFMKRWPRAAEVKRHVLELRIANSSRVDQAKALEEYKKLILTEPLFPPAVLRYANLVADLDFPVTDATFALDQLGSDIRRFAGYHLLLAKFAYRLGNLDDSKIHLNRAAEMAPANIDVLEMGARLSAQSSRPREAIVWFDRILEIQPRNRGALEGLVAAAIQDHKCVVARQALDKYERLRVVTDSGWARLRADVANCK